MVEGAKRQKTPNEIALTILLVALTIVLLLANRYLACRSRSLAWTSLRPGTWLRSSALVALLVCPDSDHHWWPAVGHRCGRGMSRMMQANVIATSGRAVEAAGDVDVLLLDKTGTITLGNRQASAFVPALV